MLINEILLANEILEKMHSDLENLAKCINYKFPFTSSIINIAENLLNNKLPLSWFNSGLSAQNNETIFDFLKQLLRRLELLRKMVYTRKFEVVPVIPLGKLFDPFYLLLLFLTQMSKLTNVI